MIASKAFGKSSGPRPSRSWRPTLSVAPAASVAARPSRWSWFAELQSTATREAVGTTSFRNCSPFPLISTLSSETPVIFPPGRPRLGTIPVPTGSPTAARTIGIVRVTFFAAIPPWVEAVTKISGRPATSSPARGEGGTEDSWATGDQLGGQRGKAVDLGPCAAEVDHEVVALRVAQLGQPLPPRAAPRGAGQA